MKFIKLTLQNGLTPVHINPDHIIHMMKNREGGTAVHLTPQVGNMCTTLYVWENADEIIQMCEEKGETNEN